MLKILSAPHDVLSSPAKPVERFDEKLETLIGDMEETLIAQVDPQGVGLAAPQVGVSLQLFIIKPSLDAKTEVFINPKILSSGFGVRSSETTNNEQRTTNKKPKENKLEGCLSIPRIWAAVPRPKKVHLEYFNEHGEKKTTWYTGLKAIIVQHEVDHLNGVLFTQRALEQHVALYEEKDGEFEKMPS